MNSKAYWNKRFEAIKLDGIKRADATVKDVQEVYAYALQRLQADVEQWYHRYALENHLSLADARKQLDARELKAFRLTLKEYQDMAKQEGLSDEHIRMLENASIRVRLDRAQQLYIQLAHHTARLANELDENTKQVLADTYESSTYKTAFETQRMQGVFKDVPLLSEESIQKAISKPWTSDGNIFSDRIWENREQLVSTLQTEITRSLIIGEGTGKLSERIAKRFDVSYHRARALIETETAHIQEEASYEQYKAHNIEQYEILATLDTKTSAICQSMDGKIIDMKDYKPGITAPPFHPHCRTTKIPYIKGITDSEEDSRAYRDEDGKTAYTDGALSYDEWYNKYVRNTDTDSLVGLKTSNGIKITKTSRHQQERADQRDLDINGIRDALLNPLHIKEVKIDSKGRPSQQFIGSIVTCSVNPKTGVITTSWKTGNARLKKYKKVKV